jgi:hydroxymethylpyrimidine pyrophosphatase-like HAD family hydrolase
MKFKVLATDYDGTIAHHGHVDEPTLAALHRAKAAGMRLMLVSGRRLQDFPAVFPQWTLFDRVVAENGAELFNPGNGDSRLLSPPPPPVFLERLNRLKVPLFVGKSVVATVKPYDQPLAEAITELGLEWHLVFNKDDVMALPSGVTKATGLLAGLGDLRIPVEQSAAIGDAENDLEMFASCGFAVAVANALDSVKAAAKWVTPGERGAGVAQLIDRLLAE